MKQAHVWIAVAAMAGLVSVQIGAQKPASEALSTGLGDLARLSHAKTRSISPENFTGEKGQGRHGDRGNRREGRARPGAGVEDLAVGQDQAR